MKVPASKRGTCGVNKGVERLWIIIDQLLSFLRLSNNTKSLLGLNVKENLTVAYLLRSLCFTIANKHFEIV